MTIVKNKFGQFLTRHQPQRCRRARSHLQLNHPLSSKHKIPVILVQLFHQADFRSPRIRVCARARVRGQQCDVDDIKYGTHSGDVSPSTLTNTHRHRHRTTLNSTTLDYTIYHYRTRHQPLITADADGAD